MVSMETTPTYAMRSAQLRAVPYEAMMSGWS
jgi:hypothetical protein